MKRDKAREVIELQAEIDEFLDGMRVAQDEHEFEMFRQMIKVNVCMIKDILAK